MFCKISNIPSQTIFYEYYFLAHLRTSKCHTFTFFFSTYIKVGQTYINTQQKEIRLFFPNMFSIRVKMTIEALKPKKHVVSKGKKT